MLKHLLQGHWLKHPLHPLLVHIPVGLWILSLVFDIASFNARDGNIFVQASYYTMLVGVIGALLAALAGFADFLDIPAGTRAKAIGWTHMLLNLIIVLLYITNLWVRYGQLGLEAVADLPFALSVIAIIMLAVSGYLGGVLIYQHGVGVYSKHEREEGRRIPSYLMSKD